MSGARLFQPEVPGTSILLNIKILIAIVKNSSTPGDFDVIS